MKTFIYNTLAISLLAAMVLSIIIFLTFGEIDSHYKKFTSPRQESLILGSSRSAQGILPSILEKELNKEIFNYSFTIDHSPFGPVYLNSIKKKIKPEAEHGIFIITVDPWSVSGDGENPEEFRENNRCVAYTSSVDSNPNFSYLSKNIFGKYIDKITFNKNKVYLHDDGWLEIDVPMDTVSIVNRLQEKIDQYRTYYMPSYKVSRVRLDYLKQTVEFLKSHGSVYLVRLPIHPEVFTIELEAYPNFNGMIASVIEISDGYLDLTSENSSYMYTDGNHLYKESSKLISKKIGAWIADSSKDGFKVKQLLVSEEK